MDSQPSQLGRSEILVAQQNKAQILSSSSSLSKSFSGAGSQSLASILNNPHAGKSDFWWSSSSSLPAPEFAPLPSVSSTNSTTTKTVPDVSRADFQPYLASISEHYARFHDIKQHESREGENSHFAGQGEALVACLREVPALYFKEDFKLEDGGTFKAACPFKTTSENLVLQEKLSQYLDTVELHLVKEISLRSSSFFEAQGQLEDLNTKILEGCSRIRELKETIRLVDSDLVGSARQIQELNGRRGNLIALRNKLKLIQYVNQALSTLKLLITSGDCAGALDVTVDLQQLLQGDELTGMHCFLHLRDHVATSVDSINSILSAEFMRVSTCDSGRKDESVISTTRMKPTTLTNGKEDQVELNEEEMSSLRDQLLPIIIGLLRTAKLPAVLRIYRDTLTTNMKMAIKAGVSELLPVLVAQSLGSDFVSGERIVDTDGAGSSLASRLRSLSAESFLQLLGAIFVIVQVHLMRASEVKKAIEWILSNLDGHYAANSVAAAIALGSAATETAQETNAQFSSLLSNARENDATSTSNSSGNFRTDVLRENTEAVFAACDTAHQRWAKLLGVRVLIHPKLRLQEFLSVYNITQEFMNATEKISGRLGYSIRGTLQSQAKAFVETQHESRMTKLRAILEQENWTEIDVPDEYQAIVTSLFSLESSTNGPKNESACDMATSNSDASLVEEAKQSTLVQHTVQMEIGSRGETINNNAEVEASVTQNNVSNVKDRERGRSSLRTLSYGGVGYHMVNCGLILLKMVSEYIDMNNCLPALSPEIVHRVVEILKFFNTRTAQLVLGAGAMQVSGLKSITSKHLALSSQVISFIYAIVPEIRRVLLLKVPDARKALLLLEIDRVAQDYKIHRDEIHSKLVQIMKERLMIHLRGLPQIVEIWNRPEDTDPQPSQFARSLTKEVGFLQRVVSRTMHEAEVQSIFRQVVVIFHTQISEAFLSIDISSPHVKARLHRDIQHILGCIRSLPSGDLSTSTLPNWGQLDEFLVQIFSSEDSQ